MAVDIIKQNFGKVWPVHVGNFVEHLIECRRTIGDLDLVLVLAAIGDRTLSERRTDPKLSYFQILDGSANLSPEDINIASLSDYTGIPRETVRRKTGELIARGWVERNEKGYFYTTQKCGEDLAATTEHGMKYLSKMWQMFEALRKEQGGGAV